MGHTINPNKEYKYLDINILIPKCEMQHKELRNIYLKNV